ncbi:hypothetical protein ACFQ68_18790 [Amycolatopsis japonica]|uniref:hypothetical protein n=1 Tax=Amycolatopsis japonica TaxID=208439 RepID=UPI0036724BF5
MVNGSRGLRAARIVATVSTAGVLACGLSLVAAPGAAAAEKPDVSVAFPDSSVLVGAKGAPKNSATEANGAGARSLYRCITQNNTPLWYHGAILRWSNAGQGLYDVMDFGGQRIWARLWGGGGTSYQIDRWNVGWCG